MASKKTKINSKETARDVCQTPPYALLPLLPYLPNGKIIWEPACGEGILVNALIDLGYKVKWSDIIRDPKEDFFKFEPRKGFDLIVTNPPYSLKYQWLERCYQLGRPFALLMPIDTLAAKTAQTMFSQYGTEIILLDARVDFKMPNKGWDGAGADYSVEWFTWGLNIGRPLTYAHLEKPQHYGTSNRKAK